MPPSNLFGLSDLIDILLVAFLIYLVGILLKRTHSYFIMGGILIVAGIYASAYFFNFFLTGLLLKYFFQFLIVILVVVFQKELRNFFEWIFVLGIFARQKTSSLSEVASIEILETVEYLAQNKIGAIIVLSGVQPLGRFLENGFVLNGTLSKPLLLSIFDPSSPGHDGAVVIEGNTVKKFGVHLPLAEEFRKYKDLGTRHRSALGLSQRSDALAIVISEERGTISLAEEGNLTIAENPLQLKAAIRSFLVHESDATNPRYRWLVQNTQEKILAILIAIALWVVFVLRVKQAALTQ